VLSLESNGHISNIMTRGRNFKQIEICRDSFISRSFEMTQVNVGGMHTFEAIPTTLTFAHAWYRAVFAMDWHCDGSTSSVPQVPGERIQDPDLKLYSQKYQKLNRVRARNRLSGTPILSNFCDLHSNFTSTVILAVFRSFRDSGTLFNGESQVYLLV
jgi:hypothetical protein